MITVRKKGSTRPLGTLSEDDVQFLREHLESAAADATSFFVDVGTVELLAIAGASPELLVFLRESLGSSQETDLELVDAPLFTGSPLQVDAEGDAVPEIVLARNDATTTTLDRVAVGGRDLRCVVCGGERFEHRRAQLHTKLATFFDMEWLGRSADCYVCAECGYIHWFLR